MKQLRLLTIALLGALALLGTSCDNDENNVRVDVETIAVTYSTIEGIWQAQQIDDMELDSATFCYVSFTASERRFDIYDNLSTMYVKHTTGGYSISQDDWGKYILSGSYDYGIGDWNSTYEVVIVAPGDKMIWQSQNSDEVVIYQRVESLPEFDTNN